MVLLKEKDFEKVRGKNRFIYRVLPALESIVPI